MGFWDWLRPKPKSVVETDLIWLTKTAKLAGLAVEVKAGGPSVVLAHFESTLREVQEAFAAIGLEGERIEGTIKSDGFLRSARTRTSFALVRQLQAGDPMETTEGEPVRMFVAERHFLRSHDDRVAQFAASLGRPVGLEFHFALDEPLMRMYTGDWAADVLRNIGMKEGESLKSTMIGRRVKAAQEAIALRAHGDAPADSPEEWLERNGSIS
jgi:hypothetical protein